MAAIPKIDTSSAFRIPIAFGIEGMSCASCVTRVERAINAVSGVETASVNLATERASVIFRDVVDAAAVLHAVASAGYEVRTETLKILVDGMSCATCVSSVERSLKAVPGVVGVSVNLASEKAIVSFAPGAASIRALEDAIRTAGYTPKPDRQPHKDPAGDRRDAELRSLALRLAASAILTLPLFVIEMGGHVIPGIHTFIMQTVGMRESLYLQFALATIVLFGPGLSFFRKGLPNLRRLAPDMNSLVVLGTFAAWAYSVVATFVPAALPEGTVNVYYEAAAAIVTLILLGRYLEARAKGKTGQAIKRLLGLQAKTAVAERRGRFVEVEIDDVVVGDVIRMHPGERVPVDGTVVSGASYVDEAMLSGEPVPVSKSTGSEVVGGTINKTGSFKFRATRVGADTTLAQIVRMVEAAQGSKLPIQALVDTVTSWFVPAVILAALLTFGAWMILGPSPALSFALVNAVAVLIIACPCAMGLATPTSIMVGTGRAAELGILFRKGEALQGLRETRVVALDKTGTLTTGKPELTDFRISDGFLREDVLTWVASLEALSEHPIAEAIVKAAEAEGLALSDVETFEAFPGYGVKGSVAGRSVLVGADRALVREGVSVEDFALIADELSRRGRSPLYVAVDGRLAAIAAVSDPIKDTTPEAIRALHILGLEVAMITGDNRRTAEAIAVQLGIDRVVAEVGPDGKVEAVKRLRKSGKVAFVGDGINDAPALAEADVGLAVGSGTDVAIESADVVLMSGDLTAVVKAIELSRATIRNIKQNLFWAFVYNASLVPVAAGLLYPINGTLLSPVFAAGAMTTSSTFVLGNALRLRRVRP